MSGGHWGLSDEERGVQEHGNLPDGQSLQGTYHKQSPSYKGQFQFDVHSQEVKPEEFNDTTAALGQRYYECLSAWDPHYVARLCQPTWAEPLCKSN